MERGIGGNAADSYLKANRAQRLILKDSGSLVLWVLMFARFKHCCSDKAVNTGSCFVANQSIGPSRPDWSAPTGCGFPGSQLEFFRGTMILLAGDATDWTWEVLHAKRVLCP